MRQRLVRTAVVAVILLGAGAWLYWGSGLRRTPPATGPASGPEAGPSVPDGSTHSGVIRSVSVTEWHQVAHPDWSEDWTEGWTVPTRSQDIALTTSRFTLDLEMSTYPALHDLRVEVSPSLSVQRKDEETHARLTIDGSWETATVKASVAGGEPLELRLWRVPETTISASLRNEPQVGFDNRLFYDQYPNVSPGPTALDLTFSKPVNRTSVEEALRRNLAEGMRRGYDSPPPPPSLTFDWTDDRQVAVRFTLAPVQPGIFTFSLAGAADQDGAHLTSHRAMFFGAGVTMALWTLEPGGKPKRVGPSTMGEGSMSPDGAYVAVSDVTYAMGDGWETAAWVVDRTGRRRYLGPGEYLTWVRDGLLVQQFGGGEVRFIPRDALATDQPAKAATILPAPDGRKIWDATAEPQGSRIAYWLARTDDWAPRLDLYVSDPDGAWSIADLTVGHLGDGFPQREPVAFGADGALYWLERLGQNGETRFWRLSARGREQVPMPATPESLAGDPGIAPLLRRAGDEMVLVMGVRVDLYNPATGTWRGLPGATNSFVSDLWVSPDGSWIAVQRWRHGEAAQGFLYRSSDLSEVGRWTGRGYGFDEDGAFYFGLAEQ